MNSKQIILILDATQRSALAATRSLGKHSDITVITASESPTSLAGNSCYSVFSAQYPPPSTEPSAFCNWLCRFSKEKHISIVYPMTEITSQLVLMCHDSLAHCKIPFASYDRVMTIADKGRLVTLAQELNIAHPETQFFENSNKFDFELIASYPAVIKPNLSHIWLEDRWLSTTVHIAANRQEAEWLLSNKEYFKNHPFLLQEFIPGHGEGIFALYNQGKPITFFAHQRIREKPPSGGVSVLSESRVCNERQLKYAQALLGHVKWHGVAMVEFRVTPEGVPYLMEVNTRFWGSLQLAIDSGVDFPWLLHQITSGKPVEPVEDYQVGQRLRWALGDLDSLYIALKSPNYTMTEKLKRIFAFFNPVPSSTRHEVNRVGDLMPAWFELKQYLRQLLG